MIVSVRNWAPARLFSVRAFNGKPKQTKSKENSERKLGFFESIEAMLEHQVNLMIRYVD